MKKEWDNYLLEPGEICCQLLLLPVTLVKLNYSVMQILHYSSSVVSFSDDKIMYITARFPFDRASTNDKLGSLRRYHVISFGVFVAPVTPRKCQVLFSCLDSM